MSENSTSEIDCNELLNQIGLGADENKDTNNKDEMKKSPKARTNNNKNLSQTNKNKNKPIVINIDDYINPKKSDFEIDDDDFSLKSESNNNSNQVKDISSQSNNEEADKSAATITSQVSAAQISTGIEDIHSYSSFAENSNNKTENKNVTDLNKNQNDQNLQGNTEQHNSEDAFNIDSISDSNKKKIELTTEKEKEKEDQSEKEKSKEDQSEKEKSKEDQSEKEKSNKNPNDHNRNKRNKPKKRITRINLSKCFDLQVQNNDNNNNNNNPFSDDTKSNAENNDSFTKINNIISSFVNEDENKNETKNIFEGDNTNYNNDTKLSRSILAIEQRISDYLNISIKKVITDFTSELSTLLSDSDLFDSTIKQFMADIRKQIRDNINFLNSDTNNLSFSSSQFSTFLPDYYSPAISELTTSADGFKDVFLEIDGYTPLSSEKRLSEFAGYQNQIQSAKKFVNERLSPLIGEFHKEVIKSSKKVKLKVKKFKLNRRKSIIYEKLFDLEKREHEHQIEARISEIKRKGAGVSKRSTPNSPSLSFYETSTVEEKTVDDIYKELTPVIKYLKKKVNSRAKQTMNQSFTTEGESQLSISTLSTSFFPVSPIASATTESAFQYCTRRCREIKNEKVESRSLRQTYQQKLQEFCSNSSLLSMEQQMQFNRQNAVTAASISLLQTNPSNLYGNQTNASLLQTNPQNLLGTQTTASLIQTNPQNYYGNQTNTSLLQTNPLNYYGNQTNASLIQTNLQNPSNDKTSNLLKDDGIENEELLKQLKLQVDEMNRKMEKDVSSAAQFIKKVTRGSRRHSVSSSHHHRRHHRHSSIAPLPSYGRGKLELSSDISLSNVSDNDSIRFEMKLKNDKRKQERSLMENSKSQVRLKDKNIQTETVIRKQQRDPIRRKSHSKH